MQNRPLWVWLTTVVLLGLGIAQAAGDPVIAGATMAALFIFVVVRLANREQQRPPASD